MYQTQDIVILMALCRSLNGFLRLRMVECAAVRRFCLGDEVTEKKLREHAEKVAAETSPNNKSNVKMNLFKRLTEISKDSYLEATSSQYDELLSTAPKVAQQKPLIPSKSAISRKSIDASQAARREVFAILHNRGMSAEDAHKRADVIYNKLLEAFQKKQMAMVDKARRQEMSKSVGGKVEKSQSNINEFLSQELKRLFGLGEEDEFEYLDRKRSDHRAIEHIAPSTISLFDKSQRNRLNIFDMDKLRANNLEFWKKWDDENTLIVNQGMGPTNAFEEQIEWTKQGKMWPYPINNEYMFGSERDVSFVDHIFLEPYWKKHKVPKSKAVEQFIELVLIGLSKNPYMSIEKKREHIDWFANYFKEVINGKYKSVL